MLALLLAAACAGGDTGPQDSTPALDPTLTNVQAEVFDKSCVFSGCHNSAAAGSLDLGEGRSYAELVGAPSVDAAGETLVVAGDSDASYLAKKLRGALGIEGAQMPSTGGPLDADRLQLVLDWIDAGAQDD